MECFYDYKMFTNSILFPSISGKRLLYETGFGQPAQNLNSYYGNEKNSEKDDFTGLNDLSALCREILRQHSIQRPLLAAYVSKLFQSFLNHIRIPGKKNEKKP